MGVFAHTTNHNISVRKSRDLCWYQHALSSTGPKEKDRKAGEGDQVSAKEGFYFLTYINADVRHEHGLKEQYCEYCLTGQQVRFWGTYGTQQLSKSSKIIIIIIQKFSFAKPLIKIVTFGFS